MSNTNTFRVFVSSTFNDLRNERNVLQNEVFPIIKAYCAKKGFQFQVIDLRWGVSNEAGLDHKAMKICLDEVKRSVKHLKPNFIVLLGDRYGWIPLQTEIEESFFNTLLDSLVDDKDKKFLNKWYKLDVNALPHVFILQPIDDIFTSENPSELMNLWSQDEKKLLNIFQSVSKRIKPVNSSVFTSATEQEILQGIFNIEERNRVLVLNRKISNLSTYNSHPNILTYIDDNRDELKPRLVSLKKRLKKYAGESYFTFRTTLFINDNHELAIKKPFLNAYVAKSIEFLKKNVDSEIERISQLKNVKMEESYHKDFLAEHELNFVGRDDSIDIVNRYIEGTSEHVCVLYGKSGVGKSALMAKIASLQNSNNIIYRFIGVTEKSSSPLSFLNDLIYTLENMLGGVADNFVVINKYDNAVSRFTELLFEISQKGGVCIFIDALDQFSEENKLEWLDDKLPINVKIIVSTLKGFYFDQLKNKVPTSNFHHVEELTSIDGENILDKWFNHSKRTLQPQQYRYLLDSFSQNGLALYLRIAFEEALKWHSYTDKFSLNSSLIGIIKDFIDGLIDTGYHNKELLEHVLGYLSASKNGLSEDELFEILSKDIVVMQSISNPYHRLPMAENFVKLPAAIWTRLYYDIVKYMSFIAKDDTLLLNFYHRQISETARDYYYMADKNIFHAKLAEFFITQPSMLEDGSINKRKSSELPYQLLNAELYSQFVNVYDLEMLSIKSKTDQIVPALLEMNDAYVKIENTELIDEVKSKILDKIAKTIIVYLLVYVKETDSLLLSVENIHAVYVYRKNRNLYDKILKLSSSIESLKSVLVEYGQTESVDSKILLRYYIAFKARYCNKIRREAKLEEAYLMYQDLLKVISENDLENEADLNELSKIEYDMGYIKYLEGDFENAVTLMHKSVLSSKGAKKPISEAISKCVEYRVRFLSKQSTAKEFDSVLDKSYQLFYDNRLKNPNAKRWVTNVLAHKFEVAFENRNIESAKSYYHKLLNDSWRSEFKTENEFAASSPDEARVLLLEGSFDKACSIFNQYIFKEMGNLEQRKKRESVSRDYYDYMLALEGAGDIDKLKDVLRELVESIPREPGNHKWIKMAQEEFKRYL